MVTASPTSTPTILTIHYCLYNKQHKPRKHNKAKHNKDQIIRNKNSNNLNYINPLIITPNPQFQSKIQALDAIVCDLEEAWLKDGIIVDTQTFCSLLETCFKLNDIDHGVRIHRLIPPKILRKNIGVVSKLLRLYATNGRVEVAHQLFDDLPKRDESAFVWNSLISGYVESGMYEDALAIYFQMVEEGIEPDRHTFPRALAACSGAGVIGVGEEIHRHCVRYGFVNDGFVLNALVDMYGKCGDIVKARKVFDKIVSKDVVSWNTMIIGYIHHGLLAKATDVFRAMLEAGVQPDEVTLSTFISQTAWVKIGSQLHGWVLRKGLESSLPIANSVIVFYSCFGSLHKAQWLFSHMPEKDIVSWNAIISAHRNDPLVLAYFEQMENSGVKPDLITFVTLLSACANLKLVKEGVSFFSLMTGKYEINPSMEHYACMVNLYGRAGLVTEAYDVIVNRMEVDAGPTVWGALLYACFLHSNAEVGKLAAHKLFELEPDNEHNFELLIMIYEKLERLDDAENVRNMMQERGLDS